MVACQVTQQSQVNQLYQFNGPLQASHMPYQSPTPHVADQHIINNTASELAKLI